MCMKNRFFRFGRRLCGAVSLLMIGALMYSCSDDYDLPDKTPSWLGSSIYNYLKENGNYTNMVKLIDDLDYATTLSRTGSKTLFVADDDAFAEFYNKNDWGVSSYDQLTQAQKNLLLHTAMLDNPYLLEMLPDLPNNGGENQCMRRVTSLVATDSVSYFPWNSPAIPYTNNTSDNDYWARFREQSKGGLYMATDATVPMMIHFINSQMEEQGITDEDFEIIAGRAREKNDVFIYGSKILDQDITCQNGYLDRLDRVLQAPTNMAEMIRTNGATNLFSHLLDRFSMPWYNATLTNSLRQQPGYEGVDSVFEKRYFSARSQGGQALEATQNGNRVSYYLNYDPGWNTYYNSSHTVNQDIGAMFVPTDEAMAKYFLPGGGGEFLMNAYATVPNTRENLEVNLDQIPLDVIQALINNLMKISFVESVPSKYLSIMNDARDPMFSDVNSVEEYKQKIDTCLIANNGVVYVMNEVRTPAKYASVSAPALVGDSLKIFNWAITADDKYITNPNSAPLNSFISTYLLAMSSNFSFFIPKDNSLSRYYDPVSMATSTPYVMSITYNERNVSNPLTAYAYSYDPATGEVGARMTTRITNNQIYNRLKDLLDAHIIVHEEDEEDGILSGKTYYTTKGGAPIKVTTPQLGINGGKVQGAWQIERDQYCNIQEIFDQSRKTNGYGNGMTYIIDRPIQSTVHSVYSVLNDNGDEASPYAKFMELCQVNEEVLREAGLADDYTSETDKQKALNKYLIFTADNPCMDYNVRFFSTYRYTVYVPTNDAVQAEINKGLPTWESIEEYINNAKADIQRKENASSSYNSEEDTKAYKTHAQAMINCLLNFVKYHFQDNAIYNDVTRLDSTDYETACINTETNRYITVNVANPGNNQLAVTDQMGHTRHLDATRQNILTRDLQFDKSGNSATSIETSSFAVIHQIDGVLNYLKELPNGRYEGLYNTTARAKRFIAKYPIR